MTPKVSVIMPVYNAETTVSRMVDSILAQTLIEWELLAIDDGSTDASGDILDQYANNDSRIRVFHKQNEGVAMARQLGVNNAIGEYSIHADADDWAEPTMLENMYDKAIVSGVDIVISDYFITKGLDSHIYKSQGITSLSSSEILRQIFEGQVFGALWNKLVRTDLYKKYNVSFYKGVNCCEDVLVFAQILQHDELKISYLPKAFYHYFMNDNSITHKITRKTYDGLLVYLIKLKEILHAPLWTDCIERAKLTVFLEGFRTVGVMSSEEVSKGFKEVEKIAFRHPSLRWRLSFFLIKLGCYQLARKLLANK